MNLMIERKDENSGSGSSGIPAAGSDGDTRPSRDGTKDEQTGAGAPVNANEELEWARRHVKKDPPKPKRSHKVFRKTELLGTVRTREDARRFRKQLMRDLKESEDAEAVALFEKVLHTFIDTVIERQNTIEDTLLLHIAELGQRADDLEYQLNKIQVPASEEGRG
jgi:hypothetical protein